MLLLRLDAGVADDLCPARDSVLIRAFISSGVPPSGS